MTDLETLSAYPALETSPAECQAWRLLADRGEYNVNELAFMFMTSESTVRRHLRGDCPHRIDVEGDE